MRQALFLHRTSYLNHNIVVQKRREIINYLNISDTSTYFNKIKTIYQNKSWLGLKSINTQIANGLPNRTIIVNKSLDTIYLKYRIGNNRNNRNNRNNWIKYTVNTNQDQHKDLIVKYLIFKNTSTLEPLKDFIVTTNRIYTDIENQIVIKSQPNSNLILNEISLDTNTNKYILVRKAGQQTQRVEARNTYK